MEKVYIVKSYDLDYGNQTIESFWKTEKEAQKEADTLQLEHDPRRFKFYVDSRIVLGK